MLTKPLDNPQFEKMSRGLAEGMTQKDAYIEAGYSAAHAAGNATTLANKAVIRNRVRELKHEFAEEDLNSRLEEEDAIFAEVPKLKGQDGVMTQQDFKLTEMWLVDVLRDNISGAQRDGKWKEANTGVQMLGNYMGGIFDDKNNKRPDNPEDGKTPKSEKKPLDIAAMAAAMNQEEDEDADVSPKG